MKTVSAFVTFLRMAQFNMAVSRGCLEKVTAWQLHGACSQARFHITSSLEGGLHTTSDVRLRGSQVVNYLQMSDHLNRRMYRQRCGRGAKS